MRPPNLPPKVHHPLASPISPQKPSPGKLGQTEIKINREKETPPMPLGTLWLMVQVKILPCELRASITFTEISPQTPRPMAAPGCVITNSSTSEILHSFIF